MLHSQPKLSGIPDTLILVPGIGRSVPRSGKRARRTYASVTPVTAKSPSTELSQEVDTLLPVPGSDVTLEEKLETIRAFFEQLAYDSEYAKQFRDAMRRTRNASRFAQERVPDDAPDVEKRRELWFLWYTQHANVRPHFVTAAAKVLDVSETWVREVLGDALDLDSAPD